MYTLSSDLNQQATIASKKTLNIIILLILINLSWPNQIFVIVWYYGDKRTFNPDKIILLILHNIQTDAIQFFRNNKNKTKQTKFCKLFS